MADNRLVTADGLKAVLLQIKQWMPFVKTDDKRVHIPSSIEPLSDAIVFSIGEYNPTGQNLFEVRSNGKIYILDDVDGKYTPKALLDYLNSSSKNFVIGTQEEWDKQADTILTQDNFGAIVLFQIDINVGEETYTAGLYIVNINSSVYILSKLGTTTSSGDLPIDRLNKLETDVKTINIKLGEIDEFITKGALTNDEIDSSISKK